MQGLKRSAKMLYIIIKFINEYEKLLKLKKKILV